MSPYIVLDFHGTVHGEFVDEAEALNLREALTAEGTEVWIEQATPEPYGDVPSLPAPLIGRDPGDENDFPRGCP